MEEEVGMPPLLDLFIFRVVSIDSGVKMPAKRESINNTTLTESVRLLI